MNSESNARGLALRCDEEGRIVEWLEEELGLDEPTQPGGSLEELVDPVDGAKVRNFLATLQTEGTAFDWQLHVRRGRTRLLLHFAGVRQGDAFVVVAAPSRTQLAALNEELMRINNEQANALRSLARDMLRGTPHVGSQEKRFEELTRVNNELANLQREIAQKNAQLEKLNQEKNRFLGMAAHDLRTPLGVILSYARFVEEEAGERLTSEEQEFLEIIIRNSAFLLRMVSDLLDVTAIEAGKLELHLQEDDLTELTRRTTRMLASLAAPKSVSVDFQEPSPPLPPFPFDADRVEQVLNNLLGNAVKFSDRGDTVRVDLRTEGGQAVLEVADSGRGIPEKLLPQLFQPFTTAGRRGTAGEESTGLGLVIARRIVQGHGGTIQVQSQEGEGSTFTVRLPLAPVGAGSRRP
jgi:two-component system, OmpR family, sensor kinase